VPVPDPKTPPAISCTATGSTTACNSHANVCSNARNVVCTSSAQCTSPGTCVPSDNGTSPVLNAYDLNANLLDGIAHFATGGMPVRISGFGTSIPGGCTDGATQYQFFNNGLLAQDFSAKYFYPDPPDFDADYTMHVRCSSDFSCTSSSPSLHLTVYRGDSADIVLTLVHTPAGAAGTTTLHWLSHPEAASAVGGYQVLSGTSVNATLSGWTNLLGPPPLPGECPVAQVTPIGTDIARVD